MDSARAEVRQFVVHVITEACRRNVDGIMPDFIRHQGLFKSIAWGKTDVREELELMTGLFRTIRSVMDEVGAGLGKPILLAV